MPFTHFWDMHSGGGQKLSHPHIFIEAPYAEAKSVFFAKFGRDPSQVTCTCCGEDYSIHEYDSLAEATAYQRGCHYDNKKEQWLEEPDRSKYAYRKYIPLTMYLTSGQALVVYAKDITPEERKTNVRRSGYVWID